MTDTSVLDSVKTNYPSQYYGVISDGKISTLIDVWNGVDINGNAYGILTLGAASTLAALTAAQWTLAKTAPMSGTLNIFVSGTAVEYPGRYYCDKNAPCAVFDMWGYSSISGFPAVTDLYVITSAAYADRQTNFREQYYDTATGALADYIPPAVVIPLKTQAETALTSARTYVYNNYGILNEATPDTWVTYLKALMAIANGTDTTSTTLPTEPTT